MAFWTPHKNSPHRRLAIRLLKAFLRPQNRQGAFSADSHNKLCLLDFFSGNDSAPITLFVTRKYLQVTKAESAEPAGVKCKTLSFRWERLIWVNKWANFCRKGRIKKNGFAAATRK